MLQKNVSSTNIKGEVISKFKLSNKWMWGEIFEAEIFTYV